MVDDELKSVSTQVLKKLDASGIKALKNDIDAFIKQCAEWKVPVREISGMAYREFAKRSGKKVTFEKSSALMKIGSIASEGNWIDLEAKAVQLWDPKSDSMAQTGLLADGTGTTKFVIWKKSGLPPLEEGKSYLIKGAVTKEYKGK
jgi:hypothetical protein